MSTSKAITKLLNQYFEDFIKSCPSDNKEGILKAIMSKESTRNFEEFIKINEIKKKKIEKDEKIPKKPKNAYMVFCDKYRKQVVLENSDKDSKEITVLLGEKWSSLKLKMDDEYFEIKKESDQNKLIYDDQMKQYRIDNNITEKSSSNTKDAFYYFKLEQKKDFAGLSKREIHSSLRKQWKKLNEEKNEIVKKYLQIATNNFEIKKDDNTDVNFIDSSEDVVVVEKKKVKNNKKVVETVYDNETQVLSQIY